MQVSSKYNDSFCKRFVNLFNLMGCCVSKTTRNAVNPASSTEYTTWVNTLRLAYTPPLIKNAKATNRRGSYTTSSGDPSVNSSKYFTNEGMVKHLHLK
jgi:hypothetical protein